MSIFQIKGFSTVSLGRLFRKHWWKIGSEVKLRCEKDSVTLLEDIYGTCHIMFFGNVV
jgi:hypothetical protein